MSKRFLLGHGERLTSNLNPPAMKPQKSHPYDNVDELYERLRPQIQAMTSFVSALTKVFFVLIYTLPMSQNHTFLHVY